MKICKNMATVLASVTVVAVTSGCGQATDTNPSAIAPSAEVFTPAHPTALKAFQAVYHTADASGKHAVDAKHLASLWLSKEMTDGDKELFVVLVQEQQLDETGALEDCHACTASVQAVTFTKTGKGWSSANFQRNIANIGNWGKAPEIDRVDALTLSPGNALVIIPEQYQAMGESKKVLTLLNHFQGKWSDAGYVSIEGDNHGTECSSDGGDSKQCFSFTGTLTTKNGKSLTYPGLVVNKKGTEYDAASSAVVPAKTEVYLFNGSAYVSAKQEREKRISEKNAQMMQGKRLASTHAYVQPSEPTIETVSAIAADPVTPSASKPAKDVDKELIQCVMPAAQYGQYSSYDGGKSAAKLLMEKCPQENFAWVASCMSKGESKDGCLMKAAILAQVTLKQFGR